MMTGWDEGVAYSRLFPSGHHAAEAIIGGSPLVVRALIVTFGIRLLQRQWMGKRETGGVLR